MKQLIYFVLAAFLVSCGAKPTLEDIDNLNGYWEIFEVKKPNANAVQYSFNATIDYFEINDSLKGYRKKLMPQLDGTFQENGTAETISIQTRGDTLKIQYKTLFAEWEESILKLNENELELVNAHKVRYIYKRYSPINLKE